MKLIPCPLNGWRNAQEFVFGGEVLTAPAEDAEATVWADYLYFRANPADVVAEWVCHSASSYWFVLARDRATDRVVASYSPAAYFGRVPAGGGDGA